jgi:hypothetical protein
MCDSSAVSVRAPGAARAHPVAVGGSAGTTKAPGATVGRRVGPAVGVCLAPQLADVSVGQFQGEHGDVFSTFKVDFGCRH